MLEYQKLKESLREAVARSHDVFLLMFEKAETAHDRVVREETTKVLALQEVKNPMRTLEDLFEKSFYTIKASAACAFVFALYAF